MVANVFMYRLHAISMPEFSTACENCPELTELRHQIQKGWPKSRKSVADELAPYLNWQKLTHWS